MQTYSVTIFFPLKKYNMGMNLGKPYLAFELNWLFPIAKILHCQFLVIFTHSCNCMKYQFILGQISTQQYLIYT